MEPTILDYLTAFGTIATPILVLILTGVGWNIRNRVERARELEEKLRDERINVYFQILEPYIIGLTKPENITNDKALKGKSQQQLIQEKILSLEYRNAAFKLSLMGSDNVVRAFNALMQGFYKQSSGQTNPEQVLLLGKFLLEVRRGVGNENTSLDMLNMLEWLITDIQKFRGNLK